MLCYLVCCIIWKIDDRNQNLNSNRMQEGWLFQCGASCHLQCIELSKHRPHVWDQVSHDFPSVQVIALTCSWKTSGFGIIRLVKRLLASLSPFSQQRWKYLPCNESIALWNWRNCLLSGCLYMVSLGKLAWGEAVSTPNYGIHFMEWVEWVYFLRGKSLATTIFLRNFLD